MPWRSICDPGFFLNHYRDLQCRCAERLGLRLHEDDMIAAFELFITDPDQSRFGLLTIRIVLAHDASPGTLISPFPYQGPALEQIFLQMQVIETRRTVALGRNLHINAHRESPLGNDLLESHAADNI